MATEVNAGRVLTLVKQGKNMREVADSLGVPVGVIGPHFYRAEVEANPKLRVKNATPKQIVQMRDKDGLRWERIAARTGLSRAAVIAAYEEAGGTNMDLLGRNGSGGGAKSTGAARKATGRKGTKSTGAARKSTGSARKTTGGRKTTTGRKATGGVRRARTRAERQARGSSNPS